MLQHPLVLEVWLCLKMLTLWNNNQNIHLPWLPFFVYLLSSDLSRFLQGDLAGDFEETEAVYFFLFVVSMKMGRIKQILSNVSSGGRWLALRTNLQVWFFRLQEQKVWMGYQHQIMAENQIMRLHLIAKYECVIIVEFHSDARLHFFEVFLSHMTRFSRIWYLAFFFVISS